LEFILDCFFATARPSLERSAYASWHTNAQQWAGLTKDSVGQTLAGWQGSLQ